MKVGTDILEINRFKKINIELFCKKYFTDYEKEYIQKRGLQSIAGIYCSKEAILKAFGIGIGNGISLKSISIIHDFYGRPMVENNDTMKKLKKEYGITECEISISHTREIVQSVCVLL